MVLGDGFGEDLEHFRGGDDGFSLRRFVSPTMES
jgi:hypothetical protein